MAVGKVTVQVANTGQQVAASQRYGRAKAQTVALKFEEVAESRTLVEVGRINIAEFQVAVDSVGHAANGREADLVKVLTAEEDLGNIEVPAAT